MPLLSEYAQRKKVAYFLDPIPKNAKILEIGCGSGWVGDYLKSNGWSAYVGLDLAPPADVVGDVRQWRQLGLEPESFDAIIAFEVVEHVDCFAECYALLAPGGRLLLTSPVPRMDWAMQLLERAGLNQKRTSPHDHLIDFRDVPYFEDRRIKIVAGLSQWGVFRKSENAGRGRGCEENVQGSGERVQDTGQDACCEDAPPAPLPLACPPLPVNIDLPMPSNLQH